MTKTGSLTALFALIVASWLSAQNDKSITIHQEIDLNASSEKVYEALLDANSSVRFLAAMPKSTARLAARSRFSKATSSAAISSSFQISESFKAGES